MKIDMKWSGLEKYLFQDFKFNKNQYIWEIENYRRDNGNLHS